MRRLFLLIIISISCCLVAIGQAGIDTWYMPSPNDQIYLEGKDDLKGLGRLFVPAMTDPDYEPFYIVSNLNGGDVVSSRMGSSIFLKPGIYNLTYGSGNIDQVMEQEVRVYKEHTTIPDINWCSLTVSIIDENRSSLSKRYEIFDALTGDSYGFGYSVEEEKGEHLATWILKPGRYKVTLNNEPFNTYINFFTIDLREGELSPLTVVVNSETGDLLGAGVFSATSAVGWSDKKRFSSALHGNANLTSDNSSDQDNPDTTISLLAQFDNRFIYDSFPYHYILTNVNELGVTKNSDSDFRISSDDFSVQNTFIYYLSNLLGIYTRLDVETHFFNKKDYLSEKTNYIKQDIDGNVYTQTQAEDIEVESQFFPFILKEGIGANLRLLNLPRANLSFRGGLGLRQEIYKNVFAKDTVIDSTNSEELGFVGYEGYDLYKEVDSYYEEGSEISLIGNFRVFPNTSYTTNADIFFPFNEENNTTLDWENILNVRLMKYLSFDYKVNLNYNKKTHDYLVINHSLFLRLTYFLY